MVILHKVLGQLNGVLAAVVDTNGQVLDNSLVHAHEQIRVLEGAQQVYVVSCGLPNQTNNNKKNSAGRDRQTERQAESTAGRKHGLNFTQGKAEPTEIDTSNSDISTERNIHILYNTPCTKRYPSCLPKVESVVFGRLFASNFEHFEGVSNVANVHQLAVEY